MLVCDCHFELQSCMSFWCLHKSAKDAEMLQFCQTVITKPLLIPMLLRAMRLEVAAQIDHITVWAVE